MSLPTQRCSYCKKPLTLPDSGAQVSTCAKSTCLTKAIVDYRNARGAHAVVTNNNHGPQLTELWKGQARIF